MLRDMKDHWELGEAVNMSGLIEIQTGGVVSRTIVKQKAGTVTVFAFDAGEGLSEHSTPFEALLIAVDGEAEITINSIAHPLRTGEMIRLPASEPHAVKAVTPFKMLLIMIRD